MCGTSHLPAFPAQAAPDARIVFFPLATSLNLGHFVLCQRGVRERLAAPGRYFPSDPSILKAPQ